MNILNKINNKLLIENTLPCKMFWVYPVPNGSKGINWECEVFNSTGDDLSNWLIIIHKLNLAWNKDFNSCRGCYNALPRGIIANNCLYYSNNLPDQQLLDVIAKKANIKLGSQVKPCIDNKYGINKDELSKLENILGQELQLQFSE